MLRYILLAVVAGLLVGADAKDDKAKAELKKFEGNWVMASGERDGQKLPDEHVRKSRITWKGKEVAVDTPHQSKETIKATVTVNPAGEPKEMDFVRSAGPGAGKPMRGIYEFTGDDEYRICFAPAGKPRPKEFRTEAGSGHMLHVWKRAKE
jgi:uncharacterized protein (TIGR03067 family)